MSIKLDKRFPFNHDECHINFLWTNHESQVLVVLKATSWSPNSCLTFFDKIDCILTR